MPAPSFRVKVPDFGYWRRQITCQAACPVHTDALGYVRAIADGNPELAYIIAREPNPFASICGRVCAAPCEVAEAEVRTALDAAREALGEGVRITRAWAQSPSCR